MQTVTKRKVLVIAFLGYDTSTVDFIKSGQKMYIASAKWTPISTGNPKNRAFQSRTWNQLRLVYTSTLKSYWSTLIININLSHFC